jgi:RNA polymerase sigma-70 factor (ECF subfamily)
VSDAPLALVESPDQELDRAVDSWVRSEALDSLSSQHREVLVEVYYRGRSVAEAAEVLGVPAGTVKSRTYYALRALKLTLEEKGLTP